jgi:hypothetical protein
MTPADLLAEQFGLRPERGDAIGDASEESGPGCVSRGIHTGPLQPLSDWTPSEQARHRAELFAAVGTRVTVPPRPPRPAKPASPPSWAVREALIDGLPPDSRDHIIVIRAARS